MSVQFGRWVLDGMPQDADRQSKVALLLAPFGPDGCSTCSKDGVTISQFAFHTTWESREEPRPYVCASGQIIAWDGRLDNRADLVRQLPQALPGDSGDVAIVAAAVNLWGTAALAKLIGDWALSIWDPRDRSLILAIDPIGVRHLYYAVDSNQIVWSTILDPLVLLGAKIYPPEEEYIAGWLSFFPATHLTPYSGILAVPSSSFVHLGPDRRSVTKYWDFDPARRLHLGTDEEFEEHFRALFRQSVRRRLRSDAPILAELSGGIDSSSIVCMADEILAEGESGLGRVETISYYSDAEGNWDERPFFRMVEEKRGRTGLHIAVHSESSFDFDPSQCNFRATPAYDGRRSEATRQFKELLVSHGHRVLLSGIGGDEVTGAVPTPTAELAELLVSGRFSRLASQAQRWALSKRKPWFHLLFESIRHFLPPDLVGWPKRKRPASWIETDFIRRHRDTLMGYESRWIISGPWPGFQDQLATVEGLRRQIACHALASCPPYEPRFPYLDRDLLEFLCAVPPEQLLRPGQRRSLMRRALKGIVPKGILDRKRKAYVTRIPRLALDANWSRVVGLTRDMRSSALGVVNSKAFLHALESARIGQNVSIVPLLRTTEIELWLRGLERGGTELPASHNEFSKDEPFKRGEGATSHNSQTSLS